MNESPATGLEETLAVLLAEGAPGAAALAAGPWGRASAAAGLDFADHPLQATTPLDVGSVTKTFVAALVLALADDGRLELDDAATAYLPPRFATLGGVTVRSLLNHTSGLPDVFEDPAFAGRWRENPSQAWNAEEVITISLGLPRHEPGIFGYANSNYVLIGLLIESVTSSTVSELLYKRILAPLGLTATHLPASATAAGGLLSTTDDVARFLAALVSGEIIGESSLGEMLTAVPCSWEESQGYGLGIERVESLMGFDVSPCGSAWGHIGFGHVTTVAFTVLDATRQIVLMANAMLTSDAAWAALNRATWETLCSSS